MTIYETITKQIVDAIESGASGKDLVTPWTSAATSGRPINLVSRKPYRGVNILSLWIASQLKGYSSPTWATFKQWSDRGASIRKGEKATQIVFWKSLNIKDDEADSDADGENEKSIMFAKGYHVFNATQVTGYDEAPPVSRADKTAVIANADAFVGALGAKIVHGEGGAYYRPSTDTVNMPPRQDFVGSKTSTPTEAYYSVLLHELTHWTGHKSRLDRLALSRFGSEQYAAEELVAELGAAFLCADLGLSLSPRPDHAQYIASWLKALKADPRAIFQAASKAQQAVDFMNSKQQQVPQQQAA